MLAQLLRRTIFAQLAVGAVLVYWLQTRGALSEIEAVAWVCAVPFLVMALVDIYTAAVSRGPEPWGPWIRSLFGEYRAGVIIFLFRQPWAIKPPQVLPATGAVKRVPVVLVHGYLCNHRIWDDITPLLRAQGHDVYAVNLEPLFCSIDQYAQVVESAVQALLTQSGQQKVALVGHSMGGLAIRAWLRTQGPERAARVLTLGTPHVGTRVPQHLKTKNGIQMTWKSKWLDTLTRSETLAIHQLFHIAITPQDNIVYPQRSQVLPNMSATVFEGIGHLQMCLDSKVIQWLRSQLADVETTSVKAL
jgi:triacylglycerol lipase